MSALEWGIFSTNASDKIKIKPTIVGVSFIAVVKVDFCFLALYFYF